MTDEQDMGAIIRKVAEFVLGCSMFAVLGFVFAIGWEACVRDAEHNCYRGTALALDCDLFSPCVNVPVIDRAAEYARAHPECARPLSAIRKES